MEKTRDLFKETGDIKGTCHARIGMIKDRNGFPDSSDGKESTCNEGDLGLILGLGRYSGGGHGNPLQCSCLKNPRDRGAW